MSCCPLGPFEAVDVKSMGAFVNQPRNISSPATQNQTLLLTSWPAVNVDQPKRGDH